MSAYTENYEPLCLLHPLLVWLWVPQGGNIYLSHRLDLFGRPVRQVNGKWSLEKQSNISFFNVRAAITLLKIFTFG